ncbi:MAG: tetratricopeptide repeat protein [Planctomycetes bacterium]|nr:tetratricopeptide repeat protein [Planctomycetota bacterium]
MPYFGGTTLGQVVRSISARPGVPSSGKELWSTLERGWLDTTTGSTARLSTEAYVQRAELREAAGDRDGAIEDYTLALATGTVPVLVYFKGATTKHYNGDHAGAKADREAGFKATAADELSWVARAENRLGDDQKGALADVDEVLKINPWSEVALQLKAAILSEGLKRTDDALAVRNKVVELHPDSVALRAGRGVLLARTGKRAEAHRDAADALRRHARPQR